MPDTTPIVINARFIDALAAQLADKEKRGLSFPANYNVNNELVLAYLTLQETGILKKCDKASIANALVNMCVMGLSVEKKQCYFIPYGDKCVLQRSYLGDEAMARRCGLVQVSAQLVYQGDTLKYTIEHGEPVISEHLQEFENIDPDKIIGAYAKATMSDGTSHTEIMTMPDIYQAWRQNRNYRAGSGGVHEKFKGEMCKKTVIRRCLKRIISTYGEEQMVAVVEDTPEIANHDIIEAEQALIVEEQANNTPFEFTDDVEIEQGELPFSEED